MNRSPSPPQVEVQIAGPEPGPTDSALLQRAAEAVLEMEGQTASGGLCIAITDDAGIQRLNLQYLGIDAPTDVLAFSARESEAPFVTPPEEAGYLGDVIISLPRAQAQAAEQGHRIEDELALLVVHGVLHLLGYDHATPAEEAAMWARQAAILARLR